MFVTRKDWTHSKTFFQILRLREESQRMPWDRFEYPTSLNLDLEPIFTLSIDFVLTKCLNSLVLMTPLFGA